MPDLRCILFSSDLTSAAARVVVAERGVVTYAVDEHLLVWGERSRKFAAFKGCYKRFGFGGLLRLSLAAGKGLFNG